MLLKSPFVGMNPRTVTELPDLTIVPLSQGSWVCDKPGRIGKPTLLLPVSHETSHRIQNWAKPLYRFK